jgi:hypothetical protein
MKKLVALAVAAAAVLVVGGIVLLLVVRARGAAIKSLPPDLVLTITRSVPFEEGKERFGNWRAGTHLKIHPDAPDRYLLRAARFEGRNPWNMSSSRVSLELSDRSAKPLTPTDQRLRIRREDESEEFRLGKVLDIDIANRRLTISDNETWDRALPPESVEPEASRKLLVSFTPSGGSRADASRKAKNSAPRPRFVGGSHINAFGSVKAGKIRVYGVFDVPWDEFRGTDMGSVLQAISPSSPNAGGNGHLFVQFVDPELGRRIGPVFEAQTVVPIKYGLSWGSIVTPDDKFILVVTDEEESLMSVNIVTRVSVIRTPEAFMSSTTSPSTRRNAE